jgi:lysophospholipase L1-like esterase
MLKWLSLHRWENYCLLAMASVACLIVVSLRGGRPMRVAQAAQAASTEALIVPVMAKPETIYRPKLVHAESRSREPAWVKRHNRIVEAAKRGSYDVMLLGDSITQGWEFNKKIWARHFPNQRVLNAGIASDRVEHILWRVQHGLLDTARPKVVVLMGGINNLGVSNPDAIADGLRQIIAEIQSRSPKSRIIVQGLYPTGREATDYHRAKVRLVNLRIAPLADGERVEFYDFGDRFLGADGWISKKIMFDYLHLTRAGYEIWANALEAKLGQ